MNKQVPFNGYTTSPSDRQCPDGDLSLCYNAISEEGSLTPILPPMPIVTIAEGYAPVFIHKERIIFEKDGTLYWRDKEDAETDISTQPIGAFSGYRDIAAMGSLLVIAMADGLRYACWKDNAYVVLGSKPPRINVQVGSYTFVRSTLELENNEGMLCDLTPYIDTNPFNSALAYAGYTVPIEEDKKPDVCNLLLGAINKLSAKIMSDGFFPYPFFLRFAYRLFDGTHTMVTAPQLIVPSSTGKPIFLVQNIDNKRKGIAVLPATQLAFTFRDIDHSWDDYVTHIDVLISPLLYGYTPDNKGFDGFGGINEEDQGAFCSTILGNNIMTYIPHYSVLDGFLNSYVQKVFNKRENTGTYPVTINGTVVYRGWLHNINFLNLGARFVYGKTHGNRDNFKLCAPLTADDINQGAEVELTQAIITTAEAKLAGLYNVDDDTKIYDLTRVQGAYNNLDIVSIPHAFSNPKIEYSYTVPTRPNEGEYIAAHFKRTDDTTIEEQIRRNAVFHVIKSIPIEQIHEGVMEYLELKESDIANIPVKETVSEDFRSSDTIVADHLFPYNSRLTAAVEKVIPTDGGAPTTLFSSPYYNSGTKVKKLWVELNDNGNKVVVTQDVPYSDQSGFDLDTSMWLYYPSLNARYMGFVLENDIKGRVPLKRHDFLNGTYFFNDFKSVYDSMESVDSIPQGSNYISVGNQICNSEVGNPFHFPLQGWSAIGNGKVIGLSSAVQALSQGQFGQFPLYAFTTEGVWALSVSAEGTYTACQPVTRDVCLSAKGITQLDNSVVFPSEKGLMRLSGSNAQCLSESINDYLPFDVCSLAHMQTLYSFADIARGTSFVAPSFRGYIKDCNMLFDHIHERLYVTNDSYPFSYVLSLKTLRWAMCRKCSSYALNAYPNALGVLRTVEEKNNATVITDTISDYSQFGSDSTPFLIVTRPMKLDQTDVLKTIDGVYLRCLLYRLHNTNMVLWGSRDSETWVPISSAKNHYMVGQRGDGYKFFRLAVQGVMNTNHYLNGVDIDYRTKQTNRIR